MDGLSGEPTPQTTVAIILGASQFPKIPSLSSSEAFKNSSEAICKYLHDRRGLALPEENVLYLFDSEDSVVLQDQAICEFLQNKHDIYDVLVFYIGHGNRLSDDSYSLTLRSTQADREDITGYSIQNIAKALRNHVRFARKYLILDACYSAMAYSAFQDVLHVTLLCAAHRSEPARTLPGQPYTMFSGALLDVLAQGDVDLSEKLSLKLVGECTRKRIQEKHGDDAVMPVIHSPDQREGDVAEIPLFPNPALLKIDLGQTLRYDLYPDQVFGRESLVETLKKIWQENNKINIVTLHAWSGFGKTAAIRYWLRCVEEESYLGAKHVFGRSFFRGGQVKELNGSDQSSGQSVTGQGFIRDALQYFGKENSSGSLWDQARRLAACFKSENSSTHKERHSLIIMDGLEPFQSREDPVGLVKDPGLLTFLEEIAQNSGVLCVITSRLQLQLSGSLQQHVKNIDLENEYKEEFLENIDKFFRAKGINNPPKYNELKEKHPYFLFEHILSLVLLSSRGIKTAQDLDRNIADVERGIKYYGIRDRKKSQISSILELVMERDISAQQKRMMQILSLSRRPISIEVLKEVCDILKRNDRGVDTGEIDKAIERLDSFKLLAHHKSGGLDLHPSVREYLIENMEDSDRIADNGILYDYYYNKYINSQEPDDIDYLFEAVAYGCLAKKHEEVWNNLFWSKIREDVKHYSGNTLGRWSDDFVALSHFFEKSLELPSKNLSPELQAYVLNEVGFDLRALGRLEEALQVTERALRLAKAFNYWEVAAIAAGNLSKVSLSRGYIIDAIRYAEESKKYAQEIDPEKDKSLVWRMSSLTWLGEAYHYAGCFWESERAFRQAESIWKEEKQQLLEYTSLFRYCELLLDQAEFILRGWVEQDRGSIVLENIFCYDEAGKPKDCRDPEPSNAALKRLEQVSERVLYLLEKEEKDKAEKSQPSNRRSELYIGLYGLILGRIAMIKYEYFKEKKEQNDLEPALEFLVETRDRIQESISSLIASGHQRYLAMGLLAQASFFRNAAIFISKNKEKSEKFKAPRDSTIQFTVERAFDEAYRKLNDALEIITRGSMQVLEVDYLLELARWYLACHEVPFVKEDRPSMINIAIGQRRQAMLNIDAAEALILKLSYNRRKPQINEIREEVIKKLKPA